MGLARIVFGVKIGNHYS